MRVGVSRVEYAFLTADVFFFGAMAEDPKGYILKYIQKLAEDRATSDGQQAGPGNKQAPASLYKKNGKD